MFYNIEDRSKIVTDFQNVIELFEDIKGKDCLNNITNSVSGNEMQNLIYTIFKNSKKSTLISKIIAKECIKSEAIAAGSSSIILRILSYYFERIKSINSKRERLEEIKRVKNEISECCLILDKGLRKANKKDFNRLVKNLNLSDSLSSIISEIIFSMKIGEKVSVKKSRKVKSFYSLSSGNFIKIEIPQIFLRGQNNWSRDLVRVLLVDGIIENPSSIHHLLEKASNDKNPYLVICRKVSDETRRTVDLNFIRETVDLIIAETGFGLDFHHFFNDASRLFNSDFVNIKMGDTISSKIDKLIFTVDHIKIDKDGITFNKLDTDKDLIFRYIADIKSVVDKISIKNLDDIQEITMSVNSRIKFLQSSKINLFVGEEDILFNTQSLSIIDSFFRSIRDMNDLGIIQIDKNENKNNNLFSIFQELESEIVTQRQAFQSLLCSLKIYETILKAEKIFTIEK